MQKDDRLSNAELVYVVVIVLLIIILLAKIAGMA